VKPCTKELVEQLLGVVDFMLQPPQVGHQHAGLPCNQGLQPCTCYISRNYCSVIPKLKQPFLAIVL
jgi:hypothetical protein